MATKKTTRKPRSTAKKAAKPKAEPLDLTGRWPQCRYLEICNWPAAQKYQKINPPWVKLYTSLAENPGWLALDDRARSLLINLWLLAAKTTTDGKLWGDPAFLAAHLPLNGAIDLEPLIATVDKAGKPAPFVRYLAPETPTGAIENAGENDENALFSEPAEPLQAPLEAPVTESFAQQEGEAEAEAEAEKEAEAEAEPLANTPPREKSVPDTAPAARAPGKAEAEVQGHSERQREADDRPREPKAQPGPAGLVRPARPLDVGPPTPAGRSGFPTGLDAGPPRRAGPRGGTARLLAECLGPLDLAQQNTEAASWVRAVFDALRLGYSDDSKRGRQECGSLAAMYNETIEARLPATLQAKVLLHDLGEAVTIGLKRPGQIRKAKGAALWFVHKQRLEAAKVRACPSGPAGVG